MKLKFKKQKYQTLAVDSVVDCFNGQPPSSKTTYRIDPGRAKKNAHIYDYVITDSGIERTFVQNLDISSEVVVYAKLPKGFSIPTPVGNYNPDWAISFKEGAVKHVYFVAETKGTMSSIELRPTEQIKIACARKFFAEINRKLNPDNVKYAVVDNYGKLMEIVGCW